MNVRPMLTAVVVVALALPGIARASIIATDNAGNSPYVATTAFHTQNGGSGFGAWNVVATTNGSFSGNFVAAASNASDSTPAWDIYADTGESVNAYRPFTGGALAVGQSVVLTGEVLSSQQSSASPGNGGWALTNSSNTNLIRVYAIGGTSQYVVDDANGATQAITGSAYNFKTKENFTFKLLDATGNYSLTLSGNSAATFNGKVTLGTGLTQFDLIDTHGGASSDVQLESLAVTPEPASFALVACGGVMALLRRRRV